ncbi:MAG: DUF3306 domain-containing protein [Roseovarius sp.]|nr:DUF3306 domain-containing protein [Roseovarius sp.]
MSRAEDFWSRRKARVREEEAADAHAVEVRQRAERERELEARSDDEILQELGLPDPDTLEPGDDFGAFMARAVPERIRRRALRRLWRSNAALANLDGLLDYGEDYTDSATVIEGLQTAYQVGRGMVAHVREAAADAVDGDEAGDRAPGDVAEEVTEAPAEAPADVAGETTDRAAAEPDAAGMPEDEVAGFAPPRRRMQFRFPDGPCDRPDDRPGGAT